MSTDTMSPPPSLSRVENNILSIGRDERKHAETHLRRYDGPGCPVRGYLRTEARSERTDRDGKTSWYLSTLGSSFCLHLWRHISQSSPSHTLPIFIVWSRFFLYGTL